MLALALLAVPAVHAQREPHIGYVYPAGGQQGTTFEVLVGGQYLNGAGDIWFSGTGIEGLVVEHEPPLTPKQVQAARERMDALRKQTRSPAVLKEMATIARQLAVVNKRRANPVLADTIPVEVTIARNAAPGNRELRLITPGGLSNPLVFQVGTLPEFQEPDPENLSDAEFLKQFREARAGNPPPAPSNAVPTVITLPAVVNGQIMPGGIDRYRFPARKGQQLVVAASARELIPYLADAVPGWFQATLALSDAQGIEVAYNDDFRFHPDPVLFYSIPKDGDYVLEIRDALYRGREDFVYRVALGELPFVTSIFPLGGKVGDRPTVEVRGWNLPVARVTFPLKDTSAGTYPLAVRGKAQFSNELPFAVDTLPEAAEQEPNNTAADAQRVTLPVIINGRSDQPGDMDVFAFNGQAGDKVVVEVRARRLDSPLDSVIKLTDSAGTQVAFNDDHEDKGSGLNTHHADSYISATLPAAGRYLVQLWDAQRKGGWAYGYRLRISPPRPDFALRVVPSSLSVRPGQSVPVTVFALRADGFAGEITLALKDAPAGVNLNAALLPAGRDLVKLTVTAPASAAQKPVSLQLEGRATINGAEVRRPAVPADDLMQAFAYRHLVTAHDLELIVGGRPRFAAAGKLLTPTPVKLVPGGTARLRVSMSGSPPVGKVGFELSEPPDGISVKSISTLQESTEIVLQTDAAAVKPGLKGNLIVKTFAERPPPAGQEPAAARRRIPLGALPAIPFEIIAP